MPGRKKPAALGPLLDQKVKDQATLKVLTKEDPDVEEILGSASHVTLYGFDLEEKAWSRKNVEGTLFVVKRRTLPRFQFVVLNRLSTENCRVDLLGEFEFELSPPYLLYRSSKEVNGIWFYRQEECDEMSALFTKITSAFSKQVTTPEEMTTDMILQSMGIGGAGAEVASAQEPEPQQYESNSVTALFKAASLGQESGQSPATNDAELDLEPVTAPKREKKQREPKEPKAEPSGGGLNRESVRAAMYKLVSNDNFIDLIVKELKRAM